MRRMLLMLGICGLVVLTAGATGCQKKPDAAPATVENPSISEAKKSYTEALSRAKNWQANATLTRIWREFDGSLTPESPPPVNFAFASLVDPTQTLLVSVTPRETSDRKIAKPQFELAMLPVDPAEWQVAPDKALEVAETAGGKKFREQHLAGYQVLQQLSKVSSYPLQWYFRYDSGDDTAVRYEVWVNATSGQVDNQKQSVPGVPSR